MRITNLNYYYYVKYYEELELDKPKSDVTADELKNRNKKLTRYKVSESELMMPLPESLAPDKIIFQTAYPGLLIGTGIAHSFNGKGEAALGMCLDYVTGMPYIPASSVKGVLRSAFQYPDYIKTLLGSVGVQNSDSINIPELETRIFGNAHEEMRYSISPSETDIFFDAVIVSTGKLLATDVITSHRGNKELLELAEPNPITMIRIRPGVQFRFQFSLKDDITGITRVQKLKLFQKIIEDFGIGAKTNVGYGTLVDSTVCPNCGRQKSPVYPLCQGCASRQPSTNSRNNIIIIEEDREEKDYDKSI